VLIGCLAALAGFLLPAMVGRGVVLAEVRDRYSTPALMGVAIFMVGILGLMSSRVVKAGLLVLLIGSAVMFHSLNGYWYAQGWAYQKSLAWQLWWRAPHIEPGSLVVIDAGGMPNILKIEEIMGLLAYIYDLDDKLDKYIGSEVVRQMPKPDQALLAKIAGGHQENLEFMGKKFQTDYGKSILVSMPTVDSCLHVADSRQPLASGVTSKIALALAKHSRAELISPLQGPLPPQAIFGPEPPCSWCYIYQKADLARQLGRWREVVELYQRAKELNLSPKDPVELLPFVEAFLQTGRADQARELAQSMLTLQPAGYLASRLLAAPIPAPAGHH
jgi:hypothetical protein